MGFTRWLPVTRHRSLEACSSRHYLSPWRVDVHVRPRVPLLLPRAPIARILAGAVSATGAPSPGLLEVHLTNDRELSTLNAEQMGREGPTDVLSFPLLPPSAFPPHPGKAKASDRGPIDPTSLVAGPLRGRVHLGEIVISVERAIDQARSGHGGQEGGTCWAPADELRLLLVHGALHLCGWDHADAEEAGAMRALERELLSRT